MGVTTPDAGAFNQPDTGAYRRGALVFRDTGTPHPNAGPHDWAAVVGSTPAPNGGETGPGHWGPQSVGRPHAVGPPAIRSAQLRALDDARQAALAGLTAGRGERDDGADAEAVAP